MIETLTKNNLCEELDKIKNLCIAGENDDAVNLVNYMLNKIKDNVPKHTLVVLRTEYVTEKQLSDYKNYSINFKYQKTNTFSITYYQNQKNGETYANYEEAMSKVKDAIIVEDSRSIFFSNYQYVEELNCIVGYECVYRKNKNNYEFKILNNEMQIITSDKKFYEFCSWGIYMTVNQQEARHLKDNYNFDLSAENRSLQTAFYKMFNTSFMNVGANRFLIMNDIDAVAAAFCYKAKLEVKSGRIQNKINELIKIDLSEKAMPDAEPNAATISIPYYSTSIEKVNDNTCVLRWTMFDLYSGASCDGLRIYIEKDKIYACKKNNNNEFVKTSVSNLKPENFLSSEMEPVNPNDLKGTILEYYGEIINDIPTKYRSVLLLLFIQNPKIEQLFKIGLSSMIYLIFENSGYSVMKGVDEYIGYDKTQTKIFKCLGVNKYQLNKYANLVSTNEEWYSLTILKNIKHILDTNNLAMYDNKTFDIIFDALLKNTGVYYEYNYMVNHLMDIIRSIKSLNNEDLFKNFIKIIPKFVVLRDDDKRLYRDYIDMVVKMNGFKFFKMNFKNEEDIKEMHDAAVSIYNLKKFEIEHEAFVRQLKKIQPLEYNEKDGEFCVVIPTAPEDLAVEGLELHHCVKTYIDKVANGSTNIVFIRKKDEKDKPFFTVEVSNYKSIEQVHGFANRNANTEKGLTDFVSKWAKSKKLKLTNINKVR